MRRLVIFAALLSLLGLSTAFAASFTVQSEDIASFTTDVSISVPTTEPTPFPDVIYARGMETNPTGSLELVAPAKNDSVQSQLIGLDATAVERQTDPANYRVWIGPAAPPGGFLLRGTVRLEINQFGDAADRLTAGLFRCPAAAAASTTVPLPDPTTTTTTPAPPLTACTLIAVGLGDDSGTGNGNHDRVASFGAVDVVVPAGHQLRLKVVNRAEQPVGEVASRNDWTISWGYLPSRPSQLVVTHP